MKRLLVLAAVFVTLAGIWLAAVPQRPSAKLADQVCVGLFGGDSGVCLPTPH
jgi:hypothetical protein